MSLLHAHLQRYEMLMHVEKRASESSEGSKSKTEAVYVPRKDTPIDEIQSNSVNFDLFCDGGGYISFINKFCYMGTIISSNLSDKPDITQMILQASKAFSSLRSSVYATKSSSALPFDAASSWKLS